jgi:ribonucleoside-triphosphate reductase
MCCRLQLDRRELRKRGGGLFGADEFTGSIGVVTVNLPRIGYLCSTREDYFSQLGHLMDLARESLEMKRQVITRLMDQKLFPYTQRYLRHWNNHFSTIGLIGMNESTLNFMGKDLSHPEAREFAAEVLGYMRDKLVTYQEQTGHLYNLEATPGEGTSYRLAKIDRRKFSRMTIPGDGNPYYTNSTQLPVNTTDDMFEALEMQRELQKLYTGGTVFHGFIGEAIDDVASTRKLVRKIAENFDIPYFTLSPTFSVCRLHGYLKGEHFSCPNCGEDTEVYSRIVGYYRPVKNWNLGKKSEYRDRRVYRVDVSSSSSPAAGEVPSQPEPANTPAELCQTISAP